MGNCFVLYRGISVVYRIVLLFIRLQLYSILSTDMIYSMLHAARNHVCTAYESSIYIFLDNINDDMLMKSSSSAGKNILIINKTGTALENDRTVHDSDTLRLLAPRHGVYAFT